MAWVPEREHVYIRKRPNHQWQILTTMPASMDSHLSISGVSFKWVLFVWKCLWKYRIIPSTLAVSCHVTIIHIPVCHVMWQSYTYLYVMWCDNHTHTCMSCDVLYKTWSDCTYTIQASTHTHARTLAHTHTHTHTVQRERDSLAHIPNLTAHLRPSNLLVCHSVL